MTVMVCSRMMKDIMQWLKLQYMNLFQRKYSMCAHSGALKRFFFSISAKRTIQILISVYIFTLLMSLFYFCN